MVDLDQATSYMQANAIDAWLIFDFRGSNPTMWQMLGERKMTTRRSFLLIPRESTPRILAQKLDGEKFADVEFPVEFYLTWQGMHSWLKEALKGYSKVAMEYSPEGALPIASWVDGGMLDLIRSFGVEVVSSADIFQIAAASWTPEALNSQLRVKDEVNQIKDIAFNYITQSLRANSSLTEYDVQELILHEFERRDLETEDVPVVAVGPNSGKPHYMPSSELYSTIKHGDWVLIDLWARYPGDRNVFSDITWVGYVGEEVPSQYQIVFNVVKAARDQVIIRLKEAWNTGESLQGWQLDEVAQNCITEAGYGQYILHRTGHSIGPGAAVHALGVNLDNFETHDTRSILPGIGFSIEPGIYLPEFGVRLETNVYMDPVEGPMVTAQLQDSIIKLA